MTERFLAVDAASVRSAISQLREQYPEIDDDDALFMDTIAGETNLFELIDQALDIKLDADEMATAIKARVDGLEFRKKRFENKSAAMKSIIQQLMEIAKQQKLITPVATISVTAPRERTVIKSEEELPQGYFTLVRKPDTAAITAALKAGETIPGAELETGKAGLMIRTK